MALFPDFYDIIEGIRPARVADPDEKWIFRNEKPHTDN